MQHYEDHIEYLTALARRSFRHEAYPPEDLVQDTLVHAYEKTVSLRPGSNIRSWLSMMMANLFFSKMRRLKLEASVVADGVIERTLSATDVDGFELRDAAVLALEELHIGARAVAELVLVHGWSVDYAAEVLGINPNTARSRLHRARMELRDKLERFWDG